MDQITVQSSIRRSSSRKPLILAALMSDPNRTPSITLHSDPLMFRPCELVSTPQWTRSGWRSLYPYQHSFVFKLNCLDDSLHLRFMTSWMSQFLEARAAMMNGSSPALAPLTPSLPRPDLSEVEPQKGVSESKAEQRWVYSSDLISYHT
jgi:hypothetical protein